MSNENFPRIQDSALSLDALLAGNDDPACGGTAIFSGTVRNHHGGRGVDRLRYTAHVAIGDKMIREIEEETKRKFDVPVCQVIHRVGDLKIGDSAIIAVTRAPHRAEAFAALKYAVHEVKHRVPIWKEEFYADGDSQFVEGCCIADDDNDGHDHAHTHNHNDENTQHA